MDPFIGSYLVIVTNSTSTIKIVLSTTVSTSEYNCEYFSQSLNHYSVQVTVQSNSGNPDKNVRENYNLKIHGPDNFQISHWCCTNSM